MGTHNNGPGLSFAPEADRLIDAICHEAGVSREIVDALVRLERGQAGKLRRRGLFVELEQIIDRSLAGRSKA